MTPLVQGHVAGQWSDLADPQTQCPLIVPGDLAGSHPPLTAACLCASVMWSYLCSMLAFQSPGEGAWSLAVITNNTAIIRSTDSTPGTVGGLSCRLAY